VPACQELVDGQFLGGADGSCGWIAVVLCAEIPARGPFVVEANTFVAVGCKLLAHRLAVGEDEVVMDVCDHDDDGRVVRAIGINAIIERQIVEVLGQIVEIYFGLLLRGLLVVHVLDVYASVGHEFL
jgi:hypothetical protein